MSTIYGWKPSRDQFTGSFGGDYDVFILICTRILFLSPKQYWTELNLKAQARHGKVVTYRNHVTDNPFETVSNDFKYIGFMPLCLQLHGILLWQFSRFVPELRISVKIHRNRIQIDLDPTSNHYSHILLLNIYMKNNKKLLKYFYVKY